MPDEEVINYYVVRVPSYGDVDKLRQVQVLELCRGLEMKFGDGVMVQLDDATWWYYDKTRREGDRIVQCHPPDLKAVQKAFKPKRLKVLVDNVIHMRGNGASGG